MSGKYINRLPRGMPADQTRALSDVFQDLHRDATQFQLSASGATARSVQQKLSDIKSIKDKGSLGDDSNDDTSLIQACLNDGGHWLVPAGTYRVSSTGLSMSVAGTVLELMAGATISFQSATSNGITVSAANCSIVGPGKLKSPATFDGSNGSRTYAVLWITGEDFTLQGVHIDTIPRCGIRLEGVARAYIRDNLIEGKFPFASYVDGTTTAHMAIDIDAPTTSGTPVCSFVIVGNRVTESIQGVFVGNVGSTATEGGLTITGNSFTRCWDHAVYGTLLEGSTIGGNNFYDCRRPIVVDGLACSVVGNVLYSTEATNSYGEQHINVRECSGAVISGNTIYGKDACIRVDAIGTDAIPNTIENVTVAHNLIYRIGTAAIGSAIRLGFDADTCRNNVIESNIIFGSDFGEMVGVIQLEASSGNTGSGNAVRNNVILWSSVGNGIQLTDQNDAEVSGNVLECTASAGSPKTIRMIYLINSDRCNVATNTLRWTTGGTNITARGISTDASTCNDNRIAGNRFKLSSASLAAASPIVDFGTATQLERNQLDVTAPMNGSFTWTSTTTSHTINNANVVSTSRVTCIPASANAGAVVQTKGFYVTVTSGSFTINTGDGSTTAAASDWWYVIE